MAAVTLLGSTFDTNSGTKTVTATPAVGDLILIIQANTGNTSIANWYPTDNNPDGRGDTVNDYLLLVSPRKNTNADRMAVWVRNQSIGNVASTVFTVSPGVTTGGGLFVVKVTGISKSGASSIRQVAEQENQAGGGTPTPVMSQAVLTANPVISAVLDAANPGGVTPRASYTSLVDTGYATPTAGLTLIARNSGETASSLAWGGTSASAFCSFAIELDIAAQVDVLSGDQLITSTFRNDLQGGPIGHLVSFDPATGEVLWTGGPAGVESNNRLENVPFPSVIVSNPVAGPDGLVIAVNSTRDRLFLGQYAPGYLYILNQYLVQLDMVDLEDYLDGADTLISIQALASIHGSSDVLALVEVIHSGTEYVQFMRIDSDGALVKRWPYFDTPSGSWNTNTSFSPMAVARDFSEACFLEPVQQDGHAYVGPTSPPAPPTTDPDAMNGPFGQRIRRYDMTNEVELPYQTISTDNDVFGMGYAPSKEILVGFSQEAISCDVVTALCNLVDTNFGPGYCQRYKVGTGNTPSLKATYPADPDCVWFEEDGDYLSRDASWFDPTDNWQVEVSAVVDEIVTGVPYKTIWELGDVAYTAGYINLNQADNVIRLDSGFVTNLSRTLVATPEPYTEYRFKIVYNAALTRLTCYVDDVLVSTDTIDFSAQLIDPSTEYLGSDTISVGGVGVSRFVTYQNGSIVSNTPLLDASNVLDVTSGAHHWTRNGSLADDDLALNRYGMERGPVAISPDGIYFWYAKYVRELRNSRIMFVERNIRTRLRRRFFLADWQDWEGASNIYYPAIHSIVAATEEVEEEEETEEPEFDAATTSVLLCWQELSITDH